MTIGGLSQTMNTRDLVLGIGDSGLWDTRLSMARANESPAAVRPVSMPNRRATGPRSSSRFRSNSTVRMPSRSNCAAAVTFGPERYSTTRSGRRAATASTFGGMPSPTLGTASAAGGERTGEHTSEIQSQSKLVFRLLLLKKNNSTAVTDALSQSSPDLSATKAQC